MLFLFKRIPCQIHIIPNTSCFENFKYTIMPSKIIKPIWRTFMFTAVSRIGLSLPVVGKISAIVTVQTNEEDIDPIIPTKSYVLH